MMKKEDDDVERVLGAEINGNVEEKRKLGLMRVAVEKKDPVCKEIDDLTLRRFLRARDLDVDKATEMFIKYITWRQTFVPKGSIPAKEIPNEIVQNKMFMQGTDKRGCPISVVLGARHFSCKGGTEEFKKFVVFGLDRLCSSFYILFSSLPIPDGQEKFTIIGDLKGYGYCNSDVRGFLAALVILQNYYPERLGKVFLVNAPYIFMTAWKIVYPFIDKSTKKKFIFVENKNLTEILKEDIDESQISVIYGGKLQLIPIHEC